MATVVEVVPYGGPARGPLYDLDGGANFREGGGWVVILKTRNPLLKV
jgi:hypothetical protein